MFLYFIYSNNDVKNLNNLCTGLDLLRHTLPDNDFGPDCLRNTPIYIDFMTSSHSRITAIERNKCKGNKTSLNICKLPPNLASLIAEWF